VVFLPSVGAVSERRVLDEGDIARALRRIAGEIADKTKGASSVALVGIRRGGVPLATRLRALLKEIEGREPPLGTLDITLYRDDAATALPNPHIGPSAIDFDVAGRTLVLVDDVLFTGRTVRAAIDAVLDYGRPKAIQLAVLVDRGHRELPVQADYVGRVVQTSEKEHVEVRSDPDEVVIR